MKRETACDLSLIKDLLDEYAPIKGSLITILQKTQSIYGYLPEDAIYYISERTGNSPALSAVSTSTTTVLSSGKD